MGDPSIEPLITTIIPTFRRPDLLKRSIRSVLNQTFPDFRVCVYDNASGDETESVVLGLEKEDPRVRYHRHSANIGALQNLLFGMKRVSTPFFSFLSDDDVLLPGFYQAAAAAFRSFPEAKFFAGSSISITEDGEIRDVPLCHWSREGYFTPPEGLFEMAAKPHPTWTAILFRSEVLQEVGTLDLEVGSSADLDFSLRIAARFPFVVSREPCALFVSHDRSFSDQAGYRSTWPGWNRMIRNLTDDEKIPEDVRRSVGLLIREKMRKRLFKLGFRSALRKQYRDAVETADILKGMAGGEALAFVLRRMADWAAAFSPVYYCVSLWGRVFWLSRRLRFQKRYGEYAKFLDRK